MHLLNTGSITDIASHRLPWNMNHQTNYCQENIKFLPQNPFYRRTSFPTHQECFALPEPQWHQCIPYGPNPRLMFAAATRPGSARLLQANCGHWSADSMCPPFK